MVNVQIEPEALVGELAKAGVVVRRVAHDADARSVLVAFRSADDAASFLNLVARYVPEGEPFFARVFGGDESSRRWVYSAFPIDANGDLPQIDFESLNWRPRRTFTFVVTCRFPVEDLPIIFELVRDFNARS